MTTGLFVNHKGRRCGVYQFGRRLYQEVLSPSLEIRWQLVETDNLAMLAEHVRELAPDFVLLNYHPLTLGFVDSPELRRWGPAILAIAHEFDQQTADCLDLPFADFALCPDPGIVPRNPIVLPVTRFIPAPVVPASGPPEVFTVGSFGFATPEKGFERLCALVDKELDRARIRINIPAHDSQALVPQSQIDAIVESCRAAITKPGIELDITHDFLDDEALMRFLSENTINAFLYTAGRGRGISSVVDHALASGRPLAVSGSPMFRNVLALNPSISVEERTLSAIAAGGTAPLAPLLRDYSAENARKSWQRAILEGLERLKASRGVPDGRGFNKILDDRSRQSYAASLADLERHAKDMLNLKYPRANIQQAFALDTCERILATKSSPRILAVGSYEDTCVATLRAKGWRIEEVDPVIDGRDLWDYYVSPDTRLGSFDLVVSVSVLEHVEDDVELVRMVADLLAPGGVGVFTVDFREGYKKGDDKPGVDYRLYSHNDIARRLMGAMPDCALLDRPVWREGVEDFDYHGCHYGFASWVFRKLETASGGSAWLGRHVAELEGELATLKDRHTRLVDDLAASDAPLALRAVLPLARALRAAAAAGGLRTRARSDTVSTREKRKAINRQRFQRRTEQS